jgi:hypothetical protein
MTTQKLIMIPARQLGDGSFEIEIATIHAGQPAKAVIVGGIGNGGVVSREQIMAMARASATAEHRYEVVPGVTRINGLIAGLKAIGLEVEEE